MYDLDNLVAKDMSGTEDVEDTSAPDERTSLVSSNQSQAPNIDDDKHAMAKSLFYALILVLEVVGMACIYLVVEWTKTHLGGYAWDGSGKEFNWHPVLMVLGMVFFYGNAAIAYRALRSFPKYPVKLFHGVLNMLAAICAILGLVAVFDFHNHNKIPNMYSLHSWLGITTASLFIAQYVFGFLIFLLPMAPANVRALYLNIHVIFGVGLLPMSAATCVTGITEKLLFSIKATYSKFPVPGLLANSLGVGICVFVAVTLLLVLHPIFKRRPDAQIKFNQS